LKDKQNIALTDGKKKNVKQYLSLTMKKTRNQVFIGFFSNCALTFRGQFN